MVKINFFILRANTCLNSKTLQNIIIRTLEKNSKKIQDVILYGSDDEKLNFHMMMDTSLTIPKKSFEGVINNLERRYLETDSEWKREEISQYQSETNCEKCKGMRLKDEALCVKVNEFKY